jgi:hypothetical protein
MARILFIVITMFCTSLTANGFDVYTPEGEFLFIETDESSSVSDIKEKLEQVTGYSSTQQKLIMGDQVLRDPMSDDAFAGEDGMWVYFDLTPSLFEKGDGIPRAAGRDHSHLPTDSEKADIEFIVTTMGNSSLPSIAWNKSKLKSAGDRIDRIHPLRFLEEVFTNDKTIVGIYNLRSRGWLWDRFTKGLFDTLTEESNKDNLNSFIAMFATSVKVDKGLIKAAIVGQRWSDFLKLLIKHVEREGDPDDFDF